MFDKTAKMSLLEYQLSGGVDQIGTEYTDELTDTINYWWIEGIFKRFFATL